MAAFVDAEHALDPVIQEDLGVDVDNLLVSQPTTVSRRLKSSKALVRSNAIDVLVVDSVAALVPKAELDGEMGRQPHGPAGSPDVAGAPQADRDGREVAHLPDFHQPDPRKIGVMFGNPETTTGGRALKFYSSVPH